MKIRILGRLLSRGAVAMHDDDDDDPSPAGPKPPRPNDSSAVIFRWLGLIGGLALCVLLIFYFLA